MRLVKRVIVPLLALLLASTTLLIGRWPDEGLLALAEAPPTAATALSPAFRAAVLRAARQAPPAPTAAPPLPVWLPAGVLGWEDGIRRAAAEAGLDPLALAALMATECPSGDEGCLSGAGAMGLMQVMPGTAASIGNSTGLPCASDPYDGLTSLRCGAWYFVQCLRAARALWRPGAEADALGVAAAGYNGGPGFIPLMVEEVLAGVPVCDSPPYEESRRECRQVVGVWLEAGRK